MGIISRIRLRQFRNYSFLDLKLDPGLNVLLGANGQGKTNLLEAVCYLALLRSFRCRQTHALRQCGEEGFSVGGTLTADATAPYQRELVVDYGERRQLRIEGTMVERASEFINQFLCVPLVPEDIELVRGTSRLRRRFMDIILTQTVPAYLLDLQRYSEAVQRRNIILRRRALYADSMLEAYDQLLLEHGIPLLESRRAYLTETNDLLRRFSDSLFGSDKGCVSLKLSSNVLRSDYIDAAGRELRKCFWDLLRESRDRDRDEGRTSYGPHRDSFTFLLGGRDMSLFGSEGECRMATLALRLSSLELIKSHNSSGLGVVLLVDDVFGDLDQERRAAFFRTLASADQTLLACTRIPAELADIPGVVFDVVGGTVVRR